MKRKLLIIFLIIAIFILNIQETYANILDSIMGGLSYIGYGLSWVASIIIYAIVVIIHKTIFFLNNSILAPIIDYVHKLNPFDDTQSNSPAKILWSILKNFAYIILVFSSLAAGFQWLLGEDRTAQALIFKIIVVALLINFTFTFIKEAFLLVYTLEKGLTGGNIEGAGLGTLIAASLWQKDPIKEITSISNNAESGTIKNLSETIGYLMIIFFDLIISIILIISGILIFSRFIMIIFLAATSTIATGSLAFPKFEKGVLGQITGKLVFFESWLGETINWLLVIPVFSILVILGNTLKNNVLSQSKVSGFFEFAIVLLILAAWYAYAIETAKKLSGKVGDFAYKFALGILSLIGLAAGRGIGVLGGRRLMSWGGRLISKVGSSLASKVPVNRFTAPLIRTGGKIKQFGEGLGEKANKSVSEAAQIQVGALLARLQQETDPSKIQKIQNKLANLTGKAAKNPHIAETVMESLSKANSQTISQLFQDPNFQNNFSRMIQRRDLADKTKGAIANIFSKLNADRLVDAAVDKTFMDAISNADRMIQSSFYDAIKNADPNKFISKLNAQLDKKGHNIDYFNQFRDLKNVLDEKYSGLITAIESGNITNIITSLRNNPELLRNINDLKSLIRKNKTIRPKNVIRIIKDTFHGNVSDVLIQIQKSNKQNMQEFVRTLKIAHGGLRGSQIARKLNLDASQTRALQFIYNRVRAKW